jgi:gamma-tubulin complex component 2
MRKLFSDNSSSSRISSGVDFDEPNLSGMEGFTFQVDVKWPVSLVLNSADLSRYQMVFRHLFFIKHVERLLCRLV